MSYQRANLLARNMNKTPMNSSPVWLFCYFSWQRTFLGTNQIEKISSALDLIIIFIK